MMERLLEHARRAGDRRALERQAELEGRLREVMPSGIEVVEASGGVALRGRGVARRLVLEPELRWSIREAME